MTAERRARRIAVKKEWDAANAAHVRAYAKARYWADPVVRQRILDQNRASRQRRNPEARRATAARYLLRTLDKSRAYYRDRFQRLYHTDVIFNLTFKLRRRIYMAIRRAYRGIQKADKTIALLGCSYEELRAFIEAKFSTGMTWDAVMAGAIHIDHVIPLAKFDLADPEQQAKAFHYSNLQPLWALDNIKKGAV